MNPMTDKFDLLILAELQQDARLPTPSWPTGSVSPPQPATAASRLRESGLIEREVALVAPSTMGWPITMLVLVTLERDHGRIVDEMIASLQRNRR
jgi:Lrp/AsnC family leucine-responsive transcriptional regulator